MEPVMIVFILATGFIALIVVLPLIFWFTQGCTQSLASTNPKQSVRNVSFEVKSPPAQSRQYLATTHLPGTSAEIIQQLNYYVKPLPGVMSSRAPLNKRLAVSS